MDDTTRPGYWNKHRRAVAEPEMIRVCDLAPGDLVSITTARKHVVSTVTDLDGGQVRISDVTGRVWLYPFHKLVTRFVPVEGA